MIKALVFFFVGGAITLALIVAAQVAQLYMYEVLKIGLQFSATGTACVFSVCGLVAFLEEISS